jgi:hypothetical protein
MYCSLLRNRWTLEPDIRILVDFANTQADTIAKRLVAAFVIYYYKLLKDANRRNVPILNYDLLMQLSVSGLAHLLSGLPTVLDAEKLAYDVCQERRPCPKDFGILRADEFFARITKLARKCGGDSVAVLAPWQECESAFEVITEMEQSPSSVPSLV